MAFQRGDTLHFGQMVLLGVTDEDEDAIEAEFGRVIASFDFAGMGVRPAVPALEPTEDVDGFFFNLSGDLQLNPMGAMDYVTRLSAYYFEPGGRYATEAPYGEGGLEGFCARMPEKCGAYILKDGEITLRDVSSRFGLVEEETEPFVIEKGKVVIDGTDHYETPPLVSPTLDGSWTHLFAQSGSIGGTSSSISSVRTLAFRPDGRFTRSGFTGVSSTTESGESRTGVTSGDHQPDETGRYTIERYTLRLDFDTGAREMMSVYAPGDDLDLLVINGSNYLRGGRD